MSIYSGFATRKQEEAYNLLIHTLIGELCNRIIAPVKEGDEMTTFRKLLYSLIKKLQNMEDSKYLPPKFSESTKRLWDHMHLSDEAKKQPSRQTSKPSKEIHPTRESESKLKIKLLLETQRKLTNEMGDTIKEAHKLPHVRIRHETPNKHNQKKVSVSVQDAYAYHDKAFNETSPYSVQGDSASKIKVRQQSDSQKKYDQTIENSIISEEQYKKKKKKHRKLQLEQLRNDVKFSTARQSPYDRQNVVMHKTFISIGVFQLYCKDNDSFQKIDRRMTEHHNTVELVSSVPQQTLQQTPAHETPKLPSESQ